MGGFAWVTLATNDSYSLGALVLAHSLKKANTAHKLVVLITPSVSQPMREQLQTVFDVVKLVEVLDSKDEAHLALLKRPELGITFTKIHCWRLTEFDKCVFLDADTLVVRNCDELFEREELSAAPDFSWPDCFNSGVFVFKPSVETFDKILQFAVEKGSFDGGDQGLLNMFFSDWATQDIKKHLPFTYNLSSLAAYTYIPAFKQYGAETRIVHFIGTGKPWLQKLDPSTKIISPTPGAEHLTPMLQRWWDLFCEHVHPHLNKNLDNCNGRPQSEPVEVCSNSVINDINDESLKPCNPEPYAPYREKDDYRQFNLPYQPFDVKGTSGELLNIEFLKASAAPSPPPPEYEEKKEEEEEEKHENNEKIEEKKMEEMEEKEEKREIETKEEMPWEEEKKVEEKQIVEEAPAPKNPFDYDTFFPDEKCVNNYLEQNVMTYQPFGHHQKNDHHQENQNQHQSYQLHHETHNQHHEELHHQETIHTQQHNQHNEHHKPEEHHNNEIQEHHNWETETSHNNDQNHINDSQNVMPLPRFLTIPENDMRQSGNTTESFTHEKSQSHVVKEPSPPLQEFKETPPLPPPSHLEDKPPEKSELKKSKSMPQLDVTKIGTTLKPSVWQSQPNVSTDPKKYLMPKLKPLLPKTNSFNKTVPSSFARVTLYTEFLMSSDYKEPLNLPKDKIGFVEMQILREAHLKRSKSEGNLNNKFGPLPFIEEGKKLTTPKKRPFHSLDHSELIDIRECKRQLGNKPKPKEEEKKEEVIRPKPTQAKKIGLFKRMKSRESMLSEKRKNKLKKETKKAKENRAPKQELNGQTSTSLYTENLKPSVNGISNNVEDILKKLKNFSKDYIHYFGDIRKKDKPIQKDQIVERGSLNNNENKPEKRKSEEENSVVHSTTPEEKSKVDHINGLGSYINKEKKTPTKIKESKKINDKREKDDRRELKKPINELEKMAPPNKNVSTQTKGYGLREVDESKTTLTQLMNKIEEKENMSKEKEDTSAINSTEKLDDGRKVVEEKEGKKSSEKLGSSMGVKNEECVKKKKSTDDVENSSKKIGEGKVVEGISSSEERHETGQSLGNGEKTENSGVVNVLEKAKNEGNDIERVLSEDKLEESEDSLNISEQYKVSERHKTDQGLGTEKAESLGVAGVLEKAKNEDNHKLVESAENEYKLEESEGSLNKSEQYEVSEKHKTGQILSVGEKAENLGVVDVLEKAKNEGNHIEEVESEDKLEESEQSEQSKVSDRHKTGQTLNVVENSGILDVLDKAKNEVNHKLVERVESEDKVKESEDSLNKPEQSKVSERYKTDQILSVVEKAENLGVVDILEKAKNGNSHIERKEIEDIVEESENSLNKPEQSKVSERHKTGQTLSVGEKTENLAIVDVLEKAKNEGSHIKKVESEDKVEESEDSLNKSEQSKASEIHSDIKNGKAIDPGTESSVKSFGLGKVSDTTNKEKTEPLGNDVKAKHFNSHLESETGIGSKNGVVECMDIRPKRNGESGTVEDENPQNGEQEMSGIAGAIAQLNLESAEPSPALQEYIRRQNWETGNMDYMGKDSFDNIWAKICQTVEGKDLEALPGSLTPSQSEKPPEGVAQPTVPKPEEKVSALPKTSDLEYIETLPSEPPVRSTEEDEIIFSKPEKGAPLLSNIKEEEDKAGAPSVTAQSTPVSPATPMAAPPQAEPKTGMTPSTPQGTPTTESKPKEVPSVESKPNVEAKTQVAPGNETKVVVPPADQVKPQEVPAPETKTEVKTPAVTEEKVITAPTGPKPEDSSPGTPIASPATQKETSAALPKANEDPKTTKVEVAPKSENAQTPTAPEKKSDEPLVAAQPIELPKTAEVPKPETKETQATDSSNAENLSKDMAEGKKPLDKIKTEAPTTPESAKQGVQTPEKEAGASGVVPPQERQVPATPTITPPTPTTPTSMALMVIPKDSKSLVKLSDIIDPKKPVEEEQKVGPTAEPIPMPPIPESESSEQKKTKSSPTPEPTDQPQKTTRSDSLKDNGKQKKGVFSKILEIVGVTPKEKKEGEGDPSNSVFYDVENAKEAITSAENVIEAKEIPKEELKKETLEQSVTVVPEQEKPKEPEKASEKPKEQEKASEKPKEQEKPSEKPKEQEKAPEKPKEQEKVSEKPKEQEKASEKPIEEDKSKQGKGKGKQKPARNQKPGDTKTQSPLPKETEPPKQETPTVPVSESQQQNVSESVTKDKVKSEIEDILGKAKTEAESRLQAADTEVAGKAEELINTMKLLVDDSKEPPKVEQPDVEELKVTTPEERQKHKGEATKSKLSDQILKAIPPPRRKAISDAKAESTSSPTGAIPKTTPPEAASKEEQKPKEKPAEGGKGGKSPKPSAIPVPPPRNKPKPPQAAPSKGKGKK